MKKGDKIFLCTVGSIFVAGLAFVTAGSLFGGWAKASELVSSHIIYAPKAIFRINNIQKIPDLEGASLTRDSINSIPVTKVMDLDISLGSGDVTISTDDVNDVQISGTSTIKYEEKNNTIYISGKSGDLSVVLPKGLAFDNANINVGAAELDIEMLICNKLRLEVGTGEADIEALKVDDNAILRIGAGELTIESASISSADVDLGLGNFDFNGIIPGDLKLVCGMGNASLNLEDSKENHKIKTTCGFGNINIDGSNNISIGSSQTIDGADNSKYDVECGMGNVDLYFN